MLGEMCVMEMFGKGRHHGHRKLEKGSHIKNNTGNPSGENSIGERAFGPNTVDKYMEEASKYKEVEMYVDNKTHSKEEYEPYSEDEHESYPEGENEPYSEGEYEPHSEGEYEPHSEGCLLYTSPSPRDS